MRFTLVTAVLLSVPLYGDAAADETLPRDFLLRNVYREYSRIRSRSQKNPDSKLLK